MREGRVTRSSNQPLKKPLQVYITDSEKRKLEELRKKLGLRSWSDVFREILKRE